MTISPPRSDTGPDLGGDELMPDAARRVVGTLGFTVDRYMEGTAFGCFVRSNVPHAAIRTIHSEAAESTPGVLGVLTGEHLLRAEGIPNPYFGLARRDQPPLAVGKVRYAGEPVVLVVADTPRHARQAAATVRVEYGEFPFVIDAIEASLPGSAVLHEAWPGNECGEWALHRGDVDAAMTSADHIVESTYTSPLANALPLEPHVSMAAWDGNQLEVWTATQWPFAVRRELAHMFGIAEEAVRVRTFPLGGGFGAKSQLKIEPVVAAASRVIGVPVRVELARDEVFLTTCKHAARIRIRSGVGRDGRLLARDIDLVYNAGAYATLTPKATAQGLLRSPGPYRLPNVRIRSRGFYTNTVPSGSFRGAMTNQAAFAYESHTDEVAVRLRTGAREFRLANLLRDGDEYASGQEMDDVHFDDLLRSVTQAIDWDEPGAQAAPGHARGKGVGVIVKTSPPGSRSDVTLELDAEGRVRVGASSVDMGQGVRGTLAQITAGHLGVPYELVEVLDPDTSTTGFDSMTAGSRSTFVAEAAIRDASRSLLLELKRLGAAQLGVDIRDLEASDATLVVAGSGGPGTSYGQIVRDAGRTSLVAEGRYQGVASQALSRPDDVQGEVSVHWHQGAVAVEVDVDLETGATTLLRCHGAVWAGRVVSATRVRQQCEGGIVFGVGQSLFEEMSMVEGRVANPNMVDYLIPSMLDVPVDMGSSTLESDDEDPEIHGVGEMTTPAVAPAIANAIAAATGARIRDLPITPEKILAVLLDHARR